MHARSLQGRLTTTYAGPVTVHTYTAPDEGWQVTTHLIELPHQIIAFDGQYLLPYAREAAAFAQTLGKPITRLYVSHYHPDHVLGGEAFHVPIHALAPVKSKIDAVVDRLAREERAKFPDRPDVIPERPQRPEFVVEPGVELIDGVKFEFLSAKNAETEDALVIALPEESVIMIQDLVYDRVHLFLGEKRLSSWEAVVRKFRALPYQHVLPGHGLPGDRGIYDRTIEYLEFGRSALTEAKSGDALEATLIARFPDYGGRELLQHQKRFLFRQE
jgi:glyoxylase-like metal-dependent hydrolase (beta-lactamase superfamily II)